MMKRLLSLFAVVVLAQTGSAWADEYAHVDREVLARAVEKLAEAWTIPIVVHTGATDDFADEPEELAQSASKALSGPEPSARETATDYADLEETLLGLFTEEELSLIFGEIGIRRRR